MDVDDFIINQISGSKDSDFLQLMLSPIRRRTDGKLWPFESAAEGLIWIMKATSDHTEQKDFEDYVIWCRISQLRYSFAKGDVAAAIEIHRICTGFELYPPDEILEYINRRLDHESVVPPKSLHDRSQERSYRALINEVQGLNKLFQVEITAAIGFVQRRYEADGVKKSATTLRDYYSRHKKKAFSKTWLSNTKDHGNLTETEINEFRKLWIKCYPHDVQMILIEHCPNDVKKTLRDCVKKS